MPRSKGIDINHEVVYSYSIKSSPSGSYTESGRGEVQSNSRTEIKIRLPVMLKPGFKMAVGFKYFQEDYEFDDLDENSFPFYRSLDDKPLRSVGGTVYIVKPFLGNKFFLARVGVTLNGDYTRDDEFATSEFLRFSVAPMIGWKKDPYTSFAIGLSLGRDFGRYSVFPVFSYNQSFSRKWGFESFLPVKAKLRFTPNEKNLFYLKAEGKGANYNIRLDDPNLEADRLYILQKLEIRYLLAYEREIHDWLWFGVEAGLRSNFRFNLNDSPRNNSTIIENDFNDALLLKAGIFVVPPRKFLE
jgi:hypothetical protein